MNEKAERARVPPKDVDEYIAGFPPPVRKILREIRATARKAAPEAREVISYRMPALKMHGILVYYAAFEHHIGLFPPVSGDAAIEKAIAKYAGEKGNLRFPLDQPMPYALIARIVKLRAKQDAAREKSLAGRRPPRRAAKRS
jgi:uncharacterized protein YdhG (YjbR/CyaY superfamily)